MPGSLAQRNAAMSRLPSSGVQQPGGSISGRFASNNLPVAMSLVRMPAFVEIPHAHSATMEAPPRHLPDELLEEILLRLPPDDPACLLRASLVCKDWSGIVCGPRFRRRLHELHRTPPVLGFLHNCWEEDGRIPRFIHTTASPSFSLATLDLYTWRALDCRHRRALFFPQESDALEMQMLLWDPITGAQQRIPVPAAFRSDDLFPRAAVLCAADRCDHRDCCFGGPFRVVFLFEDNVLDLEGQIVIWACVYSSETGAWGLPTSLHTEDFLGVTENSSVLLGGSLYFDMNGWSILEYDLAKHAMSVFSPPDVRGSLHLNRINLMLTEDGRLGAIVQDLGTCLKLFTIEASGAGTDARWVLSWIMDLRHVLPTSARLNQGFTVRVMGFAEGANIIFVNSVGAGIFTIELQSLKVRKACDDSIDPLVPLVTFYTPMPRDHQECSR